MEEENNIIIKEIIVNNIYIVKALTFANWITIIV